MAGTHVLMYKDAPEAPSGQTSVTHNGITWTFDTAYSVGNYINGDYWVLDPGAGVTVNSVSPAPTGSDSTYRNGSMVNPSVTGDSGWQAYDGRWHFNAALAVAYPKTLVAGQSLV